ncbi:PhoH family protein [Novosphingobium sp. NPDC080210]|uniref:PhoH family protein n=1 Tax=Novosphingobium sp. NPDC080210 TaxID=3390596 RepID=UPI003CFE63E5
MAKNSRQNDRSSKRVRTFDLPSDNLLHTAPRTQRSKKPMEPKTEAQAAYVNAINSYDLIFCNGPMGTGKTYVAAAMAAQALINGDIDTIIVTRPSVEAEEEYGHLPGELDEKWAPFFAPVKAVLEERLGAGHVEMFLKNGKIKIAPLGFLRGHTFKDCWVLFDEAQNATVPQMKLFLTRIGENCKVIVDGDPAEQKDISGYSGFEDAWHRMKGHPQVGYVTFDVDDIVRSGLSRDILLRYRDRSRDFFQPQPSKEPVGHDGLLKYLGADAG